MIYEIASFLCATARCHDQFRSPHPAFCSDCRDGAVADATGARHSAALARVGV